MTSEPESQSDTLNKQALRALNPERFGLHRFQHGWLREFPSIGPVAFAPLSWPHNQVPSYDTVGDTRVDTNALGLVVRLQESVWGFPPQETVPINVLSILEDTGGSVLGVYQLEQGFNSDGWLGFAIGMGTRSAEMYSHMLGVRTDLRGRHGIGWYMKLLQGFLAVETGHHSMTWTFDPLRGANGRLNIEKLGATMVNLTIDKYGPMESALYGAVPTDRFTAHWDLLAEQVHLRLHQVCDGIYHPLTLQAVAAIDIVDSESLGEVQQKLPDRVRFEIPGDVDALMKLDPESAVGWRQEMREVLGALMTVRRSHPSPDGESSGPISVAREEIPGDYVVTGFASGEDEQTGVRQSFYILTRKDLL